MKDNQKPAARRSTAKRRGRPLKRNEPKQKLTLSLTPRTRHYLKRMAEQEHSSMSEVLEEWVANMMTLDYYLQPLGRPSRRRGKKAMRGQSINYDEAKVKVTLFVTPKTRRDLQLIAEQGHDPGIGISMADIVDRWVLSAAETIDLFDAMDREQVRQSVS